MQGCVLTEATQKQSLKKKKHNDTPIANIVYTSTLGYKVD
jgi:hypothetical protein